MPRSGRRRVHHRPILKPLMPSGPRSKEEVREKRGAAHPLFADELGGKRLVRADAGLVFVVPVELGGVLAGHHGRHGLAGVGAEAVGAVVDRAVLDELVEVGGDVPLVSHEAGLVPSKGVDGDEEQRDVLGEHRAHKLPCLLFRFASGRGLKLGEAEVLSRAILVDAVVRALLRSGINFRIGIVAILSAHPPRRPVLVAVSQLANDLGDEPGGPFGAVDAVHGERRRGGDAVCDRQGGESGQKRGDSQKLSQSAIEQRGLRGQETD